MSYIDEQREMYRLKIITLAQYRENLRANRVYANYQKARRESLDREARQLLVEHYHKEGKINRRWDSPDARKAFAQIMDERNRIHKLLFRRIGEKKDPDFDSP